MSDISSIEVMARMSGIPLQVKEIIDTFLLLVYDIPKSTEGNRARRKFLDGARMIGAVKHTSSCYYMPWTQEAELLAFEVATAGHACVWTSKPTDVEQAAELTEAYDFDLEKLLDAVAVRLDKIQEHWEAEHHKRVEQMAEKTKEKLDGLIEAVQRRGSKDLAAYAEILHRRLNSFL